MVCFSRDDSSCALIGRKISFFNIIRKQKLVSVEVDRATEWIVFYANNNTYVTSMKVYRLFSNQAFVTCEKYLFIKAIENLLQATCSNKNDGLVSVPRFKLEDVICYDPVFSCDEDEIYFNFDRVAYVESQIEKLLMSENDYPLLPVIHDLIIKKEIGGGDLFVDPNEQRYENADPIRNAVLNLTVPIKTYLSTANETEKQIIKQLSPYQYQPKMLQYLGSKVNENLTRPYVFQCPVNDEEIHRIQNFTEYLYEAIDLIDRSNQNHFCISWFSETNKFFTTYTGNSYFEKEKSGVDGCPEDLKESFYQIQKWFNQRCISITICKTITEECFIDIAETTGSHFRFYVDLAVFDLLAHNLLNQ